MRGSELIHHTIVGHHGEWLVFIHGLTCDQSDWQPQVDALSNSYRCLLIDSRGHGKSSQMPPPYNIQTDAQDLARLLDHLGIVNAVLIGHSRGVRVGSATATLAPHTTGGLVFVDGSQQGRGNPDAERKRVFDMIEAAESVDVFLNEMFTAMFPIGTPAVRQQAITDRAASMPNARYLELMGDMVRWDASSMEDTFAGLNVPVGVIQGTTINEKRERRALQAGEMTPFMEMIRENIADAIFESVPDVGHFTNLDAPEPVIRMIQTIAGKLPS